MARVTTAVLGLSAALLCAACAPRLAGAGEGGGVRPQIREGEAPAALEELPPIDAREHERLEKAVFGLG